jgi:spermidine synthase
VTAAAGAPGASDGLPLGHGVGAAALTGFGVMAAELTAVRLLAPHFGDSAYVWTNVIGLILAALAAGAWFGGRLAARTDAVRWLWRLLVAAGTWLAVVPFAAGPLGAWLLPADLPLDAAMPALVRGSFVATAVLFGPAMLLLGAVSPLLITVVVRGAVAVGRAAGVLGAAGTLGSLGGTFAATHWLVPEFGCRVASTVAGALLVFAAVCTAQRPPLRAGAALLLALAGTAMLVPRGPLRPAPAGRELLAERESRYQFLQVQRTLPSNEPQRTLLVVNEGLDSFHSVYVDGSSLTGGAYYDWHALAPLLAGDGTRPADLHALSIGDAAGSLRAVYAGVHPGASVDGVDIDPQCRVLGRRFFAAQHAPGHDFTVDGRVFLARATDRWHVIHVDAYAHQVYVPAHLASREFFELARQRLLPNGVLACNVGALRGDDPVLRAIGSTMAGVFGHALALRVPASRNFLVVARNGPVPEPATLHRFTFGGERLHAADAAAWRHIVSTAGDAGAWLDVGSGGQLLVDDRPALDRLLHDSYLQRNDSGQTIVCAGDREPPGAEMAAFTHGQARQWAEVLTDVGSSRAATAYLRELAGDARWSLHQLSSAVAEYEAGLGLPIDGDGAARLRNKLVTAREDLQPILAAAAVAQDLRWLQVVVVALLLTLLGLAHRMSRMPAIPSVSVSVAAR